MKEIIYTGVWRTTHNHSEQHNCLQIPMNEMNYITPAFEHNSLWSKKDHHESDRRWVRFGFYLLRLVILLILLIIALKAGAGTGNTHYRAPVHSLADSSAESIYKTSSVADQTIGMEVHSLADPLDESIYKASPTKDQAHDIIRSQLPGETFRIQSLHCRDYLQNETP